jgi:hypothetical protein
VSKQHSSGVTLASLTGRQSRTRIGSVGRRVSRANPDGCARVCSEAVSLKICHVALVEWPELRDLRIEVPCPSRHNRRAVAPNVVCNHSNHKSNVRRPGSVVGGWRKNRPPRAQATSQVGASNRLQTPSVLSRPARSQSRCTCVSMQPVPRATY